MDLVYVWVIFGCANYVIGNFVKDEERAKRFLLSAIFCAIMAVFNLLKVVLQ